jgi:hypothetical protein
MRSARAKVPGLVPGFRYHDLRHYFASLLIASGADEGRPGEAQARERQYHAGHLRTPVARLRRQHESRGRGRPGGLPSGRNANARGSGRNLNLGRSADYLRLGAPSECKTAAQRECKS